MSRIRNFVFTINNYEPDDLLRLSSMGSSFKYLVYQQEVGANGTPHIQGTGSLNNPRTFSGIKRLLGTDRVHLEKRQGTKAQAVAYCCKEDTRMEGTDPVKLGDYETLEEAGKRTELDLFKTDLDNGVDKEDMFDLHFSVFARYPKFVEDCFERRANKLHQRVQFNPRDGWQADLVKSLETPAHPRKIRWYTDHAGNSGKSTFALSRDDAYIITGGKVQDIYYGYSREPIVFFDWPRDAQDRFPYAVAEAFKNGYFLSTKYSTRRVRFSIPHVIVFANFEPERSRLSLDRWDIHNIINF